MSDPRDPSAPLRDDGAVRRTDRRDLVAAAAVALLAMGMLGGQLFFLPGQVGQFFKYPVAAAARIGGSADPDRLTDFSPLYLALHSAVQSVSANPVPLLQGIHLLFLALATALLFLFLRRHFGFRLSVAGATGFVFLRSVSVYGYLFEPEAMLLPLLVAVAWLFERRDLRGAAGAGVALALAVLGRPSFLPLAALLPLAMLFERGTGRRIVPRAALLLLPTIAAVLVLSGGGPPSGGRLLPPIMNPGTVLYDGNNPLSRGKGATYPEMVSNLSSERPNESDYEHVAYRLLARRGTDAGLDAAGVNLYWSGKAWGFLADHPLHAIRLVGRKILFIFHGHRWHDVLTAARTDRFLAGTLFPALPFPALSALAIAGLLLGAVRWRSYIVPYLLFLAQGGVMMISYASDRQRVALLPLFIFFALAGLSAMIRGGRRSIVPAIAVLVVAAALGIESDLMRDERRSWENYQESLEKVSGMTAALGRHDLEGARRALAETIALVPRGADWVRPAQLPSGPEGIPEEALRAFPSVRGEDPSARLDFSLLLIEAGRYPEAQRSLAALDREGAVFDRVTGRVAEPAYHLGRVAALQGDRAGAVVLMDRALRGSPGDPDILAALALLTGDLVYEERLSRYTDPADSLLALGLAHFRLGSPAGAVEHFRRLTNLVPESRRARFYLAASLGAAGLGDEAAETALRAIEAAPSPVLLEEWIVPEILRWAEARTGECEALRRAGSALRVYGRYEETLRLFRTGAQTGCPGAAEGIEALGWLAETGSLPSPAHP